MILVQWSCEIPQENLKRFSNFVINELKPLYESLGCIRYELFFPMSTKKQYFPYQIKEKKNQYSEQLLFNNLEDFEKFYYTIEKDEAAQNIVGMYVKEFGISDCNFKMLKMALK